MGERKYTEIAHCHISPIRQMVVSHNQDGDIVMARRVIVEDEGNIKMFFEKGATIVKPEYIEGFQELLNTLGEFLNEND